MKQGQLIDTKKNTAQYATLKEHIAKLQLELSDISNKVDVFEAQLRSHLTAELIEEQELSVLYKAQKTEKKAKRLEQKRRGKRYVQPVGLKKQKQLDVAPSIDEEEVKEKKRLYLDAMLHVHPDKFSMNDDKMDLATELTTKLIDIYKNEDLATLKAYHSHLFSDAELTKNATQSLNKIELTLSPDAYLIQEKEQLEKKLNTVRKRHTYHVLTTYKDPSTFIEELKSYYQDRIHKLRRRTRTKS